MFMTNVCWGFRQLADHRSGPPPRTNLEDADPFSGAEAAGGQSQDSYGLPMKGERRIA